MSDRRRRTGLVYPHDLQPVQLPQEALVQAKYETYRFLFNYWVWQGDLHTLCALCYLQGALDGAQVQQTLVSTPPEDTP
jgi:hypothetical protein